AHAEVAHEPAAHLARERPLGHRREREPRLRQPRSARQPRHGEGGLWRARCLHLREPQDEFPRQPEPGPRPRRGQCHGRSRLRAPPVARPHGLPRRLAELLTEASMNHARTHFRFFPSPRGDRNYLPPGPRGEGTPIALSPHDRLPTTHPPRVRGEGYSTISLPPRQCGGGHPRIPFPPRQRGEGRGGGKCGAHFLAAALLLFLAAFATAAPDCGEQGISVHCGTGPTVTFDPSGNLWAAFVQNDRIHVARAGAPGEDFGEPVPVIPDPEPIDVNGEDRPK